MLSFDPQALTSLTFVNCSQMTRLTKFRSTGSYEPDLLSYRRFEQLTCFDPQALTSLTNDKDFVSTKCKGFDPQALTSLTKCVFSSGSEWDCFDPQALTSLTCSS